MQEKIRVLTDREKCKEGSKYKIRMGLNERSKLAWDTASKMGPSDALGLQSFVRSHPFRVGWTGSPPGGTMQPKRWGSEIRLLEDCASILLKRNF